MSPRQIPFCSQIRRVLSESAMKMAIEASGEATYVCIEGPRFSTRSESKLFRQWGADIVGMTLYPECILAREAQICYASISMVTDYDVWADKPVTAAEVSETMRKNAENAKRLVLSAIDSLPEVRTCDCGRALSGAMI